MADFTAMRIDEMEGAFGGSFRRARASLGVTAFGMQVLDMAPSWGDYPEHTHTADGQEEVYLALRGSGELEIENERVRLDPDTMVRVGAGTRRKVRPGAEGMRLLVIGGVPGGTFKAHPITELGGPESMEGI
jgi:mannose-6-phosphate isomerase-like protein (cupin superfamily)